jgi:signal transduction histidine kinase
LFIAFLGIHIPLIGLIIFVLFKPDRLDKLSVIGLTLLLTLAATGITLYILNGLLTPLRKSRKALFDYRLKRIIPDLPTHYPDEAGQLMQNIQFTITELNDLLEEKKDLTSLLSHDLRIPLRNVKTFSKLLLQQRGDESVNEIAGMIYESAEEQTKLLENVLQILRQDHLFFHARQNVRINPDQLIDDIIHGFTAPANEKGIALKKEVSYNGTIEVQPELFSQVLKNLASNAIKFSHKDTEVTFRVYQRESKTFIDVKDSGIGFEPGVAEALFERFTKNGRTGTAGEPSTGIGLYLSRKIIRHHQGDLTARSEGEGQGSVFSISLN